MGWITPTRDDLTATVSAAEITAFGESSDFTDAVDAILARTVSFVRGFVRRNHRVRLGPAGTLPEGLISPAMDYAAFDVLKRLPVEVGAARVKAREEALLLFEDGAVEEAFPAFAAPPPVRIVNGSVLSPAGMPFPRAI